jgi:TetR/AcrR family transcriptional regulator, mexCD-oprJ operon repressor
MATVDHRRAVAERNRAAILDAVERLLAKRQPLNMVALAGEAGVSRPTLYAHFKTLTEVLEAAVERVVLDTVATVEATEPDQGPAEDALLQMVEASWQKLAAVDALAAGAAEHLPSEYLHHAHAPLMSITLAVIRRGQREGSLRTDLSPEWLMHAYTALIHAADSMARGHGPSRRQSLVMLKTSLLDLLRPH